jgi:ELWxxDGT repeat protein
MGGVEYAPVLHGTIGGVDYFTAATVAAGGELWRTDGTQAGTTMVQDLNPGPGDGWPINLGEVGGRIVMSAYVPAVGRELFALLPFWAASWTGGLDVFSRPAEPERLIEALSL